MAVKVDAGTCTFVIYCTVCTWWTAIRLDHLTALECANAHERRAHPEDTQASKALSKFSTRLAARTGIVEHSPDALTHGITGSARTGQAHR